MDSRLLIVKAITLVFREREPEEPLYDSSSLVKDALSIITHKTDNIASQDFSGVDPIVELRSTLNRLISHKKEGKLNKSELLQRLRINTDGDDVLYNALLDGIEADLNAEERDELCRQNRMAIKAFIDEAKAQELIKTAYHLLRFNDGSVQAGNVIAEMMNKLEPYRHIGAGAITRSRGYSEVTISKPDSVKKVFKQIKDLKGGQLGMRLGMQGLNDMAGEAGKFQRGDFWLVPAPSYSYKTGTMKVFVRQLAMHNTPHMIDITKKPLIVFWSLENENTDILRAVYVAIWSLLYGTEVDIDSVDEEEVAAFVHEHLGRNGYDVKFIRSNPADTGYAEIMDACDTWKQEGYEIHSMIIDYVAKMSTKGCIQGPMGSDHVDLTSRLRNYFSVEYILGWSPWQLNGEARRMRDDGVPNVVRRFGGSGAFYSKAKDVYQEIDGEMVCNIRVINGVSYLEYYLGKNRNNSNIRESRKYAMFALDECTGLRDDIDGKDTRITKPPVAGGFSSGFGGGLGF